MVLDPLKFGIYVESKNPTLTYRSKRLSHYDAVIPRIGTSITFYGAAVVRQFEQMGIWSANPSQSIIISRDKLRSLQVLSRYDLGIAASAFVRDRKDVLPAIDRVGGAPVIVKLLEGTQGVGVILADTIKMAEAIIETLQSKSLNVLIQKFVAESRGKDIRAFVVGDRVVAAMRRKAVGTEFRSNVHRGGETEVVKLTEEYERTAVRAAQILGLRVAGVDMLEGAEGPVIMEVNSSPGLEGIETVTGIDVAGAIVDYLVENLRFDDLDLRHRLSLARGFQVAEFTVGPESNLAGCNIGESGLRERDVIVMSINRAGQILAAPKGQDMIQQGDILLCYGRKNTLRDFLPIRKMPEKKKAKKKKTPPTA
ncbi:putative alpha-L-glutamate ligase [Cerasicoccus arenae]|uniref:Putative alpha-L-glutamate ligase n=2 Tax=Cerasicoccus arenae TaxID=424488 RepID=A0A8J3GDT8_9BACT|nr:putative alpha-L-glutamate ligase [Cerasicoccus arenae]